MSTTFTVILSEKDHAILSKKSRSLGLKKTDVVRSLIRGAICFSAHENGFDNVAGNTSVIEGSTIDVERLEDMIKTTARSTMELLILLQKFTDQSDTALADEARREQINNFKHRYGE